MSRIPSVVCLPLSALSALSAVKRFGAIRSVAAEPRQAIRGSKALLRFRVFGVLRGSQGLEFKALIYPCHLFTIPEHVVFLRAFIPITLECRILRHGGHRVPEEVTEDEGLLCVLRF